jgi:diguanylate cyclase (GGDEF)-like protein/PAS domain S-box-containing protein
MAAGLPPIAEVWLAGLAPGEVNAASDALAPIGLHAAELTDVGELLQAFAAAKPEALVLDAQLPGLSGTALCQILRRRQATRDLPIFLVAPAGDWHPMEALISTGASDVVTRPLRPALLARRLSAWIRLERREDDLRHSRRLLRTLQRVAGIATWQVGVQIGTFDVGETLGNLLGLEARGPVGVDALLTNVVREDRARLRQALQWAAESGEGFSFDTTVRAPDSATRILSWEAEVVRDDAGRPTRIAGSVQDITERAEAEERVRYLAYHDGLTGLENRHAFLEQLRGALASASRHRRSAALLFLDLDNFKRINDTLGHAVGDRLLQAVARRLEACLRESDLLGFGPTERPPLSRLGGDEFTVVLSEIRKPADAARVAKRILECLRSAFPIDGHDLVVGGSIGITVHPSDGDDVGTLLRNADVAMYEAKGQGRNTYRFFSRSVSDAETRRQALEERLRRAVDQQALGLVYQPQVDTRTGVITGVEALLRWEDPDLGPVSPGEFIPLAEAAGLIVPIDEWVLHEACQQAASWREQGLPAIHMAVNVSARHFGTESLLEHIAQTLFETGLPPDSLVLEITEHVFSSDAEAAASTLRELKRMGVRIALDDFGTGYSSLGYLKRFPVDAVKIDRSFVRDVVMDPDDAAITEAIISMARALRLGIVAEGVETRRQRELLDALGCFEMQGYLFSQPLLPVALAGLLREGPLLVE